MNASKLYSLDIFQPPKSSLEFKKKSWSEAAPQYTAETNVKANCSMTRLRQSCTEQCNWWGFYLVWLAKANIKPVQSPTVAKVTDEMEDNFTQPCRRWEAFKALPCLHVASHFAFLLLVGSGCKAGAGDASLGSRGNLCCKVSASSLGSNKLEPVLNSGL